MNWTGVARTALGLKGKLPEDGLPAKPLFPTARLRTYLKPIGVKGNRRRCAHRVRIVCLCGADVSAGRFGQHIRAH